MACDVLSFFFFKQKTAYEMRISDWSSDVCSSGLAAAAEDRRHAGALRTQRRRAARQEVRRQQQPAELGRYGRLGGGGLLQHRRGGKARPAAIGRASWRERVCTYV